MSAPATQNAARRWIPRILALAALLGGAAAVVAAVASVSGGSGLSQADASRALTQLDAVNRPLSEKLSALRGGQTARPAQAANRAAYQLATRLRSQVSSGGELGAAVRAVLDAEVDYTDAVGSTMYNPRSALRDKIVHDAAVLRAALDAANGNPQYVHGAENFVGIARARAAR